MDPIYFVFDMSESDFLAYSRAAREGNFPSTREESTQVFVKLVDEEHWPHPGAMNFVDNVVDQATGTVRARALVPNPDLIITPGQFGRLRLPGSPLYPAMLLPDDAILSDQARKIVYVVGKDDVVTPKDVRPGPTEFGLRVIRRGLNPDDRVIIDGLLRARPGSKVVPQDGTIEPADQPS